MKRTLDLDAHVTAQQWNVLVGAAVDLGVEENGFDCGRADEIRVFARPGDAPPEWARRFRELPGAGAHARHVGSFLFRGGRPVARLVWSLSGRLTAARTGGEAQAELEAWLRLKWRELVADAGLEIPD